MCKVAVIGYGVVGSGTVELFMKNRESISKKVGKECDIKYILDLRDFPDSPHKVPARDVLGSPFPIELTEPRPVGGDRLSPGVLALSLSDLDALTLSLFELLTLQL